MTPLKKYIWLVDTIMRAGETGLTLEQIADRWNDDDEMHDEGAFAKRSFHRHRKEIADLFGIEIESYGNGHDFRYRIAETGDSKYFQRWLLDSIAVNRIVTDSREAAQYIEVEQCHDNALPTLLQALKEQRMVSFDYQSYRADNPTHYFNFQPHALKMFERRWYLIGRYSEDKPHLILALDRMGDVNLQNDRFRKDSRFNLGKMFEGAYGIILHDLPIESVWLKVGAYQANYLRSLPLHASQIELKRTDEYSIFSVRVRPTYDFKQKLLSLGSTVEVIKPDSLRVDMKGEIQEMLNKYLSDDE